MFKNMLIILILALGGFAGFAAMQPAEFRVSRSALIAVPPEALFAQVNDFHKWQAWSPWAKIDPQAKNLYEGPESGTGAILRWESQNFEVGTGAMTITESRPSDLIRIGLEFLQPFPSTSTAEFAFAPESGQTRVTWSMYGDKNFIAKAMGLIFDCDVMVGGKFEEGLANLKAVAEAAR
ncbi:MAG: SRPBCC family protein [Alphaproteobacteria bacterium]